ncbi:MAG TPA: rod shape-determining protein MreC [Thioalkalivibrio sp.]|nr:rod shape-determining protein MreC [Thioalkalivibrio sp.]
MKQSLFDLGPSLTAKLVVFLVLSLSLMTLDHRFGHLDRIREVLEVAVSPIQYVVNLPFAASDWASDSFAARTTLQEENERLHREQLLLRERLQRFEGVQQENARLRELLEASQRLEQRVMVAELLSVDLDPYKQEILLNKGSRDGVRVGQPMIDAEGVMGQVVRVNPLHATAILVSDPSHALPVQVIRNGLRTLAVGTGSPERLELRHIPNSADIRVGDIVTTSGLGGRFPPDYPVAEVTEVERLTGEPFARVEARPLARIDRSREVLLVWTGTMPEAEPAAEAGAAPAGEAP